MSATHSRTKRIEDLALREHQACATLAAFVCRDDGAVRVVVDDDGADEAVKRVGWDRALGYAVLNDMHDAALVVASLHPEATTHASSGMGWMAYAAAHGCGEALRAMLSVCGKDHIRAANEQAATGYFSARHIALTASTSTITANKDVLSSPLFEITLARPYDAALCGSMLSVAAHNFQYATVEVLLDSGHYSADVASRVLSNVIGLRAFLTAPYNVAADACARRTLHAFGSRGVLPVQVSGDDLPLPEGALEDAVDYRTLERSSVPNVVWYLCAYGVVKTSVGEYAFTEDAMRLLFEPVTELHNEYPADGPGPCMYTQVVNWFPGYDVPDGHFVPDEPDSLRALWCLLPWVRTRVLAALEACDAGLRATVAAQADIAAARLAEYVTAIQEELCGGGKQADGALAGVVPYEAAFATHLMVAAYACAREHAGRARRDAHVVLACEAVADVFAPRPPGSPQSRFWERLPSPPWARDDGEGHTRCSAHGIALDGKGACDHCVRQSLLLRGGDWDRDAHLNDAHRAQQLRHAHRDYDDHVTMLVSRASLPVVGPLYTALMIGDDPVEDAKLASRQCLQRYVNVQDKGDSTDPWLVHSTTLLAMLVLGSSNPAAALASLPVGALTCTDAYHVLEHARRTAPLWTIGHIAPALRALFREARARNPGPPSLADASWAMHFLHPAQLCKNGRASGSRREDREKAHQAAAEVNVYGAGSEVLCTAYARLVFELFDVHVDELVRGNEFERQSNPVQLALAVLDGRCRESDSRASDSDRGARAGARSEGSVEPGIEEPETEVTGPDLLVALLCSAARSRA